MEDSRERSLWRKRVGVENNTAWNFKELEEMLGSVKALIRNNRECKETLIGPSMAPHFFEFLKIPAPSLFSLTLPNKDVGFGPKSCGTDGKPTSYGYRTHKERSFSPKAQFVITFSRTCSPKTGL